MTDGKDIVKRQAPRSSVDLYGDAALMDPYPIYKALRNQASAVYLEKINAYFLGRFEDVSAALNDWETFSSAKGIGLNPIINEAWAEALICQDPPVHTERRKLFNEALGPKSIRAQEESIQARARALALRLSQKGTFDGIADFAHDLPINVVMDLIGWPEDIRSSLLKIADGSWNAAGPVGPRMESGLNQLQHMMAMLEEIYDNNRTVPGGYASQLVAAGQAGVIPREAAVGMLAGYIVAAFETTIAAMGSGLWLFANNPGEWRKLRETPGLATQAANEIVRVEAPLQNFARFVTRDVVLSDGTVIPANSWAIVSYAAANRDHRQFSDPDCFRIDRAERLNLGYGYGPHACAGQSLARMELTAVFTALAERIERLEIAGDPVRGLNNVARAFSSLPMRAVPA